MMNAYLIDANQKSISATEISGLDNVTKLTGYDPVDSDEIDVTSRRFLT
jgi:hypothetical protein